MGFSGIAKKDDQFNHIGSVKEGLLHDKMDALSYDVSMYALVFFVPGTHLEEVKNALFAKGAGTMGNYDRCSFQVRGEGQFKPLAGSDPFIGSEDVVERVEEWRVEMIVSEQVVKEVIEALLAAHPYETPAYHLYPVLAKESFDGHP
jgi:hypothetical protein